MQVGTGVLPNRYYWRVLNETMEDLTAVYFEETINGEGVWVGRVVSVVGLWFAVGVSVCVCVLFVISIKFSSQTNCYICFEV